MEKFQLLKEKSLKNYQMADHMLNVTYPLIKDTKLLMGVADNLFLAMFQSMSSILYLERLYKLVPHFQDNFESKFNLFRYRCVKRHNVPQDQIDLIQELKEIVHLHKTSPVEFRRKDRFVICTKSYQMKAITANQLKKYLNKAKSFLDLASQITDKK